MKQSKHSKLPWWDEGGTIHANNKMGDVIHVAATLELRGQDSRRELTQQEAGNADLIVTAVNTHYEMLEALEFIQGALAAVRDDEPIPEHPEHGILCLEEVQYCVIDPIIKRLL